MEEKNDSFQGLRMKRELDVRFVKEHHADTDRRAVGEGGKL